MFKHTSITFVRVKPRTRYLRQVLWLVVTSSLLLLANASAWAATTKSAPPPVTLDAVTMATSTVGWAVNRHHILRTTDGGRIWRSVTPRHFQSTGMSSAQSSSVTLNTAWTFLSGQDAWVAQGGLREGAPARTVTIYRTVDGGHHWTRFILAQRLPPTLVAVGGAAVSPFEIDILGQQGWIVLTAGRAALQMPILLEHTANGGRTWQAIWQGTGNEGPVAFASPRVGWMIPGITLPLLRRTTDGGRTWQNVTPPLPPRMTLKALQGGEAPLLALPTFFNHGQGIWPIISGYGPTHWAVRLYTAAHSGRRWTLGPPNLHLKQDGAIATQVVTDRVVWVLQSTRVSQTTNGGETWTTAGLPQGFGTPIALTAVSNRTAWVTTRSRSGVVKLWETCDGGQYWIIVMPHKD